MKAILSDDFGLCVNSRNYFNAVMKFCDVIFQAVIIKPFFYCAFFSNCDGKI